MAQHLTEEEQLEKLKQWWSDNGRAVVVGVVLAVVGYFGWQGWQSQQQQARESASLLYEELTGVVVTEPGEPLSEEQRLQAASIVEELKSDYGNLLYASNAALLMARVAVEGGDLEESERQLRWVVEEGRGEELSLLARMRLAQVLYGQGDYDRALATLNEADPRAYAANYAEVRGDILVAKDQPAEAKEAYQTALDELLPAQNDRRNIIRMKLDDIQVSADDSAASTGAES